MQKTTKNSVAMLAILGAALTATHTANAQDEAPGAADAGYINVLPFYLSADANRRGTTDDGRGLGVGYGHPIGGRWAWEFQTFADSISISQGDLRDFRQYGVGLDFNYRFVRGDGPSPFVLLGAGIQRNDVLPESANDNDGFANVGFGLVTGGLGKSEIRLRAELRYVRDRFEVANEGEKNDRRLGIGVQIPLGRRTVERIVEREVVREQIVERPAPAQIVDSDNDGVPDQNDACPGTLAGLATDNRGCASTSPQVVRLEGVNFELNSAVLTADATQILLGVADALRGEPTLRAEIAGHTDSSGSDEYNQRLSQQRADSVLQFLANQGIDRSRLVARGYGESRPVTDNASAAGRERNRRVEFEVLN
jgi:OOP family OmpA-OmpF porin